MVPNPFGPSFADIVLGSNKSAYTTEEVLYAQAEANRHRYPREQALVERKRKREADVSDHHKIARVKLQKHQARQEQLGIAHEEQTVLGSSIRLKLKTYAPSVTSDTTLPDHEKTIHLEDTDLTATRVGDEEIIDTNVDPHKLDVVYDYVASVGASLHTEKWCTKQTQSQALVVGSCAPYLTSKCLPSELCRVCRKCCGVSYIRGLRAPSLCLS